MEPEHNSTLHIFNVERYWTSTGQAELDARSAIPTDHAVVHVATCPHTKHDYTGCFMLRCSAI